MIGSAAKHFNPSGQLIAHSPSRRFPSRRSRPDRFSFVRGSSGSAASVARRAVARRSAVSRFSSRCLRPSGSGELLDMSDLYLMQSNNVWQAWVQREFVSSTILNVIPFRLMEIARIPSSSSSPWVILRSPSRAELPRLEIMTIVTGVFCNTRIRC